MFLAYLVRCKDSDLLISSSGFQWSIGHSRKTRDLVWNQIRSTFHLAYSIDFTECAANIIFLVEDDIVPILCNTLDQPKLGSLLQEAGIVRMWEWSQTCQIVRSCRSSHQVYQEQQLDRLRQNWKIYRRSCLKSEHYSNFVM